MAGEDFRFKLFFLCLSHTLLHVYTNLPIALLPILIVEYKLSTLIAGIIVSIPRIFSLFFSLPSGLLSDRLGPTKLISFSLFLQVMAASLIILFPTVEIIVLSFSLTALASTFYHPPALSATSIISPSDFTSRGLGFHGASGTLGISLGPITLGLILAWAEWRLVYAIWIAPIFAIAVITLFINLKRTSHENLRKAKDEGFTTPLGDVLTLTFLSFLLLILFKNAAGGTISTYLTTYLTESKGLDAGLASIIFGLSPLIGLTSVLIGGYTGDKLGWKKSFTLIISIVTSALFCMFISITTFMTVIAYLIYGFFDIMTMPLTSSLIAEITPQQSRGTAYSLEFVPVSAVGIVIPIILGIMIDFLDIWIIFPTAITFYVLALVAAQVLTPEKGKERS